jgi:DNA-binding transcriptional ArsR family regulator
LCIDAIKAITMETRIGYFPVLDAALALRQAFDSVRFQPYNPLMEAIAGRLTARDRTLLEEGGEATRGWLWVIEALLEPGAAGLLGTEEGLLRLENEALPASESDPRLPESAFAGARVLLARTLRTGIAPEASRRARQLVDTTSSIAAGIREAGVWPYLLGRSDRMCRAKSGEIVFRVKPEMRIRAEEVERIIILPSLVVTRRLSFWRSGSTLLFYISTASPAPMDDPPDSLLISALAVGDRTRLRMLRHLAGHPATNLEMAEFLGVNPSTASRHFKLFKDAGFVDVRELEGGRAEYELTPEGVTEALDAIVAFIQGGGK